MIALFVAILMIGADAMSTETRPLDRSIAPVQVTARKIPIPDSEDLVELQVRKIEKREEEWRGSERLALVRHEAIWAERKVAKYRYTISMHGAWFATLPVVITVADGAAVSTEFVDRSRSDQLAQLSVVRAASYDTVPKLFALIQGLLNQSDTLPSVRYDNEYGFPSTIANDRFRTADDEFTFRVWDFQVLE